MRVIAMSDTIRHVIIHGKVQGVGYRNWTGIVAYRLRLEGWVRNRQDGTVEAVFSGDAATIDRMIAECRRGPPMARVDRIDERDGAAAELGIRNSGEDFSCLPSV